METEKHLSFNLQQSRQTKTMLLSPNMFIIVLFKVKLNAFPCIREGQLCAYNFLILYLVNIVCLSAARLLCLPEGTEEEEKEMDDDDDDDLKCHFLKLYIFLIDTK